MENYYEIKQKADEARKEKKWDLALQFYQQIYKNEPFNEWDSYFYAYVLEKNHLDNKSLQICRKIYAIDKNFKPNKSLYARNIFKNTFLKPNYSNINITLKALNALVFLTPTDDNYISFEMFFHKIIKIIENDKKYDFILEVLDKFKPSQTDYKNLADFEYQNKLKYPSVVETFFVSKIKALFKTKNFKLAIQEVDVALNKIKRFNYNNHVWIRRIKAISLDKSEKTNEALFEYFNILRLKTDWFIFFELSELLLKTQQNKASEFFAYKAVLIPQEVIYKKNLYKFLLNNFAENLDKNNIQKINSLLKDYKTNKKEILKTEAEIKQQAKKYFENKKGEGKIIKTLNKWTGFIKTDTNNLFYTIETSKIKAEKGERFLFEETWSFDKKKNLVKKSAVLKKKLIL